MVIALYVFFMFYSNICSSFSAAVLSELFRKWLYISVVVLVLAWPARPATVTSGTPAASCIAFISEKSNTQKSRIFVTDLLITNRLCRQIRRADI